MNKKIILTLAAVAAFVPMATLASSNHEQNLQKARTATQKMRVMTTELVVRANTILSQQTTISELTRENKDLAFQNEKLKAENKNLSDSNVDKDREIQRLSNSKTERQLEIERCDKNWYQVLKPDWYPGTHEILRYNEERKKDCLAGKL